MLEDAEPLIGTDKARRIVARQAEDGLRQIIGAKAEEFGALGDLAGAQCRPRQLDHRADEIGHLDAGFFHHLGADAIDHRLEDVELLSGSDQRHHDLGLDRLAGLLDHRGRRLEDRRRLHLVDLGIGDAEAAAAVTEHRVGLVQRHRPLADRGEVLACQLRHLGKFSFGLGQKFVERRVQQADRHRQPLHDAEDLGEILALYRQQLGEPGTPSGFILGHDHPAHRADAVGFKKHVLGAAEPDALGTKAASGARIDQGLGVGANLHAADRIRPAHQGREIAGELRLDRRHRTDHDLARRPVDRDDFVRPHDNVSGCHRALGVIDAHIAGTGNAGPPHAARYHRGVAGHTAARRQDASGRMHAVDVVRARLDAHQDCGFAASSERFGLVGREHDLA